MPGQVTSNLLMIRPVQFMFNTQTAINNAFQSVQDLDAHALALNEFDDFVTLLREHGITVMVVNDTLEPHTPDSIFPNNWISFHANGCVVLYPMFAANRRLERKAHVIDELKNRFAITQQIDLSPYEHKNVFLEGTGSMVLDRENKIAYACLSPRTDSNALADFCMQLGFNSITFTATDADGFAIYHTNVMMCVANEYVVICLESIKDNVERAYVIGIIERSGKKIIEISLDQMNHFAGNMLQVENKEGKRFLVMSSQAFQSLQAEQRNAIQAFNAIIHSSLNTIERNGGGSARCMMAEIFLPEK